MNQSDLTDILPSHDVLNPRIWQGNVLRKDVQLHLLKIAKSFYDYIGVEDLSLHDITLSGSNASYNYNDRSDLDCHLVASISDACHDILAELYSAKKALFNSDHDITIYGHSVEVYVQDKELPHISNGIYSVLRGKWIKEPLKIQVEFDATNIMHKYDDIAETIDAAVTSKNIELIDKLIQSIKTMRVAGLGSSGEYGVENLTFKLLRNNGLIEKLYSQRLQSQDDDLSLPQSA